jgi:predicted nucleotidyltransferase
MENPENPVAAKYAEKAERLLEELALWHLDGAKVVFFGSHADGTHDRRSDFDIAYLPGEGFDPMGGVVRLREDIEENNVIYAVDLVDLSNVEESFRNKILSEGVVWKD